VYCGIDVGLKKCHAALISERLEFVGDYEELDLDRVKVAGIDAPLSFPARGMLRECERLLLKMGIRLFPSGAPFFRSIALRGMEIAEELRGKGVEVYEVYPYATRAILNIAPKAKKQTKGGLEEIRAELSRWVEIPELSHDEIDAVIAALTVKLYSEGMGVKLEGIDGSIVVPRGRVQLSLNP
jgi:predicted nuclease with RNAse H fold